MTNNAGVSSLPSVELHAVTSNKSKVEEKCPELTPDTITSTKNVSSAGDIAENVSSKDSLPPTEIAEIDTVEQKENCTTETSTLPLQQPDLVASIKERPSNLPGVESFALQPGRFKCKLLSVLFI